MWVGVALAAAVVLALVGMGLYRYGEHSWRFRIDSSDQIEVSGAEHVPHPQIMEVMGGDIGRNIFFVPLTQRQLQLEQIPWVESASVMRFVPNRLRIEIHERIPIAFARIGSHISLIDAGGTLMELAPGGKHKYSFAVIAGMNAGEPLSTRAARMKNYNELVRELDSSGAHYSRDLSEVDLSDSEDVKVLAADSNGEVLVHLGSGNYLQRYKVYVTHVQQWRQQFVKLESVDLRFDGQIIVNPDLDGLARQPILTPAAAKAAVAAGVKTAAIVNIANYEKYVTHPATALTLKKDAKAKANPKAATKTGTKAAVHQAVIRHAAAKPLPAKSAPVKPSPVRQAALKTPVKMPPVAPAKNNTAKNTVAPRPVATPTAVPHPDAVSLELKKPSAGIPKETPPN